MEEISFERPISRKARSVIDRDYVQNQLKDILKDQDLRRFIL